MAQPIRVLIVEDSEDDAFLLTRELERNGYSPVFDRVDNARDLAAALKEYDWDIVISDFVMPQFTGLEALKVSQQLASDLPFIILSGKTGEDVAVDAMKAGASDYIMKNNLKRIVPAVRRELREAEDRRERKRAEEESRRNERQYRLLADNVSDVIWTSDMDLRITYMSPSVLRLIGYTSEEVLALTLEGLLPPGLFGQSKDQLTADSKEPAEEHIAEVAITRKDGSTVWTETKTNFLFGSDGKPRGILGVTRDITPRKRAEKKLLQEQEDRLHAYERLAYLGRLSGSIAHELRNPLATIDSSAHFLNMVLENADEKTKRHLKRINSAVRRSADVIQSLLDQARTKEPTLARIDLTSVVSDIIATCEIPAGVKVIKDYPQDSVDVNADKEQLRMVFQNVVRNAVEAMEEKGTLTVSIRNEEKDARVSFADTGPGIPEENLDKIFLPLFTTKVTGIGFGLSISKAIVDLHGGLIEAQSKAGQGATITVRLPLCKEKK